MLALLGRRILAGLFSLWIVSVLVFAGTEILPGDVATAVLGQGATEATKAALREQLGLERPAPVRYLEWLGGIASGDLGRSLASRRPVADIVGRRLSNTVILAAAAALVSVPLAVGLGLLGAAYPESRFDRFSSSAGLFLISVPEFLVGAVLVLLFAVTWKIFPAITMKTSFVGPLDMMRSLALPILTLTAAMLAHMSRMTRAAMLEVLRSGYIETAILKGVARRRIILRHALPNALGPIASVVALNLGYLISGVVIVETVFNYPGLGRLMVDAVSSRDIPMVQATILIFCAAYIAFNLIADLAATAANPCLRRSR